MQKSAKELHNKPRGWKEKEIWLTAWSLLKFGTNIVSVMRKLCAQVSRRLSALCGMCAWEIKLMCNMRQNTPIAFPKIVQWCTNLGFLTGIADIKKVRMNSRWVSDAQSQTIVTGMGFYVLYGLGMNCVTLWRAKATMWKTMGSIVVQAWWKSVMKDRGIGQDWCLVCQWVQYCCIHRLLPLGLFCTGLCICSAVCWSRMAL